MRLTPAWGSPARRSREAAEKRQLELNINCGAQHPARSAPCACPEPSILLGTAIPQHHHPMAWPCTPHRSWDQLRPAVSLLSVQQHRCAQCFPCTERSPCPASRITEADGRRSPAARRCLFPAIHYVIFDNFSQQQCQTRQKRPEQGWGLGCSYQTWAERTPGAAFLLPWSLLPLTLGPPCLYRDHTTDLPALGHCAVSLRALLRGRRGSICLSLLIGGKEKVKPGLSGGIGMEGDTSWGVFSPWGQPLHHRGANFKQSQARL